MGIEKPGAANNTHICKGLDSWTYEVPFQFAWVRAKATESRLDPERAVDFMEREFPSICRVRIELPAPEAKRVSPRAYAWQLRASCPFCAAGEDQLLQSDNWVDVCKWHEDDEIDLQNGGRPRSGDYIGRKIMHDLGVENVLNWEFFSKAMRAWGMEACVQDGVASENDGPSESRGACANDLSDHFVNVYGVSLPAAIGVLNGARPAGIGSRDIDSQDRARETIAWEFGVEGYFGGVYRCACCGNAFAVVYRDPYDDIKEGRYKLVPDIAEALDKLSDKGGRKRDGSLGAYWPNMSVEVNRDGNRLAVKADIAGTPHELVFDTELGSVLLDGDSYVSDGEPPRLWISGIHDNPLIHDVLSAMPQVTLKLLEMLPPMPEGVDMRPERLCELGYGINLLVAANRFVGYPSSFYEEMALSGSTKASTCGLDVTYPFETGLPRDFSGVEELYEQAGLPEDDRLKEVLRGRPQVLLDIMRKPDMPFMSLDALTRFYQLVRIEFCMRVLCFYPKSVGGWRRLIKAKGDEAVLSYIEEQAMIPHTSSNLPQITQFMEVSNLLHMICDKATDEQLASVRMDSLHEDLSELAESLLESSDDLDDLW